MTIGHHEVAKIRKVFNNKGKVVKNTLPHEIVKKETQKVKERR